MKHYSLISLFLILSVSGCSCALKGHEGTDGFDPYISAIPDSMATGSQITVKKALENIIYTGVSVEDDMYSILPRMTSAGSGFRKSTASG